MKECTRILVVTAVAAERDAVKERLISEHNIDIIVSGVGPAAAAAAATRSLVSKPYSLVINAGIAGGFPSRADLQSIVISTEIVAAELGVETPEGFCFVDELGFGTARFTVDPLLVSRLANKIKATGLNVSQGPILTVTTATGTEETAMERMDRVPGAAAEGMEGYGVAAAAQHFGIPVVEIRAISNKVGLRDRKAWKISEALESLAIASSILPEVIE